MSSSTHSDKKDRPADGKSGQSQRRGQRRRKKSHPSGPKPDEASIASVRSKLADAEYVVFDIETTGGNPEKNGITEIFAVKYKNGEPGETFYSMVNPKIPIPPIVRRMTGINNAMVRDAPVIEEVMPGFVEYIGNAILVSHNTIGDMKFIRYFAKQVCGDDVRNFFLCTHLLVEKLAKEAPDKSLRGLAEYFKLASGDLHRAEADAYVTLDLFKVLLGKLYERRVSLVEEAIRLQGDLDSGVRLGWGIPPNRLENIPQQPGVFQMLDLDRRVLFASSSYHLDREIRKIKMFDQLPRGLLRVALKSYDLKCDPHPSLFSAMLAESELMHQQKLSFDPFNWHQRVIFGIMFARDPEGIRASVGTVNAGVVLAIGPIRDRRQASEYLDAVAQVFGKTANKQGVIFTESEFATVRASATGEIKKLITAERKKRGSFRMWFKPSSRRSADQTIGQLEAVANVPQLPRVEMMLDKTGVLAVADGRNRTSWVIYPISRGRPLESFPLKGDLEPRLRDKKVLGQIKERVSGTGNGEVADGEALRINAALWMIYNGRSEGRFFPLSELESLS